MTDPLKWLCLLSYLLLFPPLVLGIVKRTKARWQNRLGAPLFQPLYDLLKFLGKDETLSDTLTWVFRSTAVFNFGFMVLLGIILPWTVFKPQFVGVDLFYVVYVFAAARFFTVLASMDAGSAFGAFGGSREVTLSLLVEPASLLGLAALAVSAKTSDLSIIFSYGGFVSPSGFAIWIFSGLAILLCSLVELSRMPVDDPTTHLELTMVHEAMILENSGRNLALTEYAHFLRMTILFGLVVQCFMHAIPLVYVLTEAERSLVSLGGIGLLAVLLGTFEVAAVKLRWWKAPDFIAYALTMSLLACFIAIGRGLL